MELKQIIKRPSNTEKAIRAMEAENKLVFVAELRATKSQIKKALETMFKVKVSKITTHITPQGEKKAFVKLMPEYKASDVAIKLGIL